MAIKCERNTYVEERDMAEEMQPLPEQSRSSSVAAIIDGPMPHRAYSVRAADAPVPGVHHPAPLTSGATSSATTADVDVEMVDDSATLTSGAMERVGQRSRRLIQVIQRLSDFNIDTTIPSLPKIILVGDQSAGKSSVIEGLCDITLPRNEGTCTKCPFLLTTTSSRTSSAAWTCRISIWTRYAYVPTVRAGQDGETFDNWQEQAESTYAQFSVIYEKAHLDQALRRAQQAILNPARDPNEYVNAEVDPAKKTQVGFSPNVVCLEIASAGLAELSFYDLPGAINSMSDEKDQHLVPFVETLLKSYIQDEHATVLLACAANQDTETSTAFRFLTDCIDSDDSNARNRAVGVLTKPDLIDATPEKIALIAKMMGGKSFRMGHGWFVTKQPTQKQLDQGITHEEARKSELDFFAASPWAQDLAAYQKCFGTPELQDALSKLLTSHILTELPNIVLRVKDSLTQVDQDLANFPAQDAAPNIAVVQAIDALKTALLSELNADALSDFRTAYRKVYGNLQKNLVVCQPVADMSTPGYVKKSPLMILDDDSDDESPTKKIRSNKARALSATPARTPAPVPGRSNTKNSSERGRKSTAGKSAGAKTTIHRNEFNLKDVKRSFDSAPGADLPGGSSNVVIKKLILDTLCGWDAVTNKALNDVQTAFLAMLETRVASALAARQGTELFKYSSDIVRGLFNELMAEQRAAISRIILRERHRPITFASEPMMQRTKHHRFELQARRLRHRVQEHFEDLESEGVKVNEADVQKKSKDSAWARQNLGNDEYEREIEELVKPLAYYDVASTQLCDTVARELEFGLLHAYEERIHRRLLEGLHTGDAAYCTRLLAEDQGREKERVALLRKKDKLSQALAELNTLPETHA